MESIALAATDKPARYRELLPQLTALLDGEPDLIEGQGSIAGQGPRDSSARGNPRG